MALDDDIPCMICGYNLRGLQRIAKCPECGKAIDESVRRELEARKTRGVPLEMSDPRWLRRLHSGGVLILTAAGILAAAFVLQDTAPPASIAWTIMIWSFVIALGVLAIGGWRLGTREGIATESPGSAALCATLRIASLLPFVLLLCLHTPGITGDLRATLAGGFAPCTSLATWAGYLWIARLLVRAGEPRWATWARRIAWMLPPLILFVEAGKFWRLHLSFRWWPFLDGLPLPIVGYAPSASEIFLRSIRATRPVSTWIVWAVVNGISVPAMWIMLLFTRRLHSAVSASEERKSKL